MDCRSAATSGQMTEEALAEGLGEALLAEVPPPDEQPAPEQRGRSDEARASQSSPHAAHAAH